jgi:hypothetical protein
MCGAAPGSGGLNIYWMDSCVSHSKGPDSKKPSFRFLQFL